MPISFKKQSKKRYPIGYVLSGGFIKGFAHLGAIQALREHDIKPNILSGVSAGAVAAAFIADGNEPYRVLDYFNDLHFTDLTKLVVPRRGFFDLSDFIDFLKNNLKTTKLEDLPIPLIITATDLDNGRSVHFTRGNLAERIAASCCMPVLFAPLRINGIHYVDGGLFCNLPVFTLRDICDKVVAINVSPLSIEKYKLNMVGITLRSYHLMFSSNCLSEIKNADLFIEPENILGYSNRDLDKIGEIFMHGYSTTKELLDRLQAEKGTIWK